MDSYVTGAMIRRRREERHMTQEKLAEAVHVSAKAVSKWETGRGYPDISLLLPLAEALGISVTELLSGSDIANRNRSFHMLRTKFYVCPICGNILWATGEAAISCHGISLPPLEAEAAEGEHTISAELSEDEYYVNLDHPMTREHHISFIAALADDGVQIKKLYPEGNAEARLKCSRVRRIYAYCKHHGLFEMKT